MASSSDIKTNAIVFNKVTEELLKTMTIEPNQFYITPDDSPSNGGSNSSSSTLAIGKLVDLTYDDGRTLTFSVNEEQNEDTIKAFFTSHEKASYHRTPIGILAYEGTGSGSINNMLSPNDLALASMQLQLSLWIGLAYKKDDYSAISSWGEIDCFDVVDVTSSGILPHLQEWNFIKLNNSILKWRQLKVEDEGVERRLIAFILQLNSMQYNITLPLWDSGASTSDFIRINQTVANTNSIRALETNLYNISASNGGFAAGKDASLGFTKEPAEGETLNAKDWINAIQLGAGTNITPRTLQVYDYQLLDANGKIPNERLDIDLSEVDNKLLNKVNIIRNEGTTEDPDYYKVINNSEHLQLGFLAANSDHLLTATKNIRVMGISDNIALTAADDMESPNVKMGAINIEYGLVDVSTMNGSINMAANNGSINISSVGSNVNVVTDSGNFIWNDKQVAVIDDIPAVLDLSNQTIVG